MVGRLSVGMMGFDFPFDRFNRIYKIQIGIR